MTRLVRTTMRLRPDRIIIGEVRGAEALALLKAWNTGRPGGVTTIHANSASAALMRLSSLVQEAGVPPQTELIAEAINLLAFIARTPAGRRVTELRRKKPSLRLRSGQAFMQGATGMGQPLVAESRFSAPC